MGRLHLFEFEDQAWCPRFIRETTTDFLSAFYTVKNIYEPAFEKIAEALDKTQSDKIIDCCSGSGGPILKLREYLDNNGKESTSITLTDRYPNVELFCKLETEFPNKIVGHKTSLDAASFPESLKGMRTLFSSFHHFKPNAAVNILQDAVNHSAPIGIFEFTERHPRKILRVLMSPFSVLMVMPKSKRLNFTKFFFTYVLPITPFTHMWECLVSNLRTYSPEELQGLVDRLDAPSYVWEIGKVASSGNGCNITYLIGRKISN